MSDTGSIKESFVEDENKVDIEATSINLDCVKNEPNDGLDFEEDSLTTQYRTNLVYENRFGEPSHQGKIKEDYDNLIGFLDNDFIMENAVIKLEPIKEEDEGSFNNFQCSKCKGIYKGYCLKCSTLLHILNNNLPFVNSESELSSTPADILEIRETSQGRGVYVLKTLPINIIFGPYQGILGIESRIGHSWKIIDNKFRTIKSGNWMKNIAWATSVSLRNLDIFQIDGSLYFQTIREITEGEVLLIHYDDEELQQLDNSEERLYTPQKREKLPKIFACTMCCLGFGSSKCLMEHKRKCQMEHSRNMKDFVLVECHYCKMWMEKWEHEQYHVAYCLEKHHRIWSDYSKGVDRSDTDVKEVEDDCGTKYDKRTYQRGIRSRPKDRRDDLQFDTKDYQRFSGGNHDTSLKMCTLATRSNNEQTQNAIETINKTHFQKHLNTHRGNNSFTCDICMIKFTTKANLKVHINNKHAYDESGKDYKCLECCYQTNYKTSYQMHQNKHRGIKFQCDICMVKFTQKNNLTTHRKNKHTDDRSAKDYQCLECSYHTNDKSDFQMHLNKHRVIKPFQCDICMVKFTLNDSLKKHIKNQHTDGKSAKDFKCSECSYQTNYKYDLQKHVNKHRGIKPFQCDICMMTFTQKGNLKAHIKNKHTDNGGPKDYKCLECFYQTNNKTHFQSHLNKYKGIKPFKCDICMMKFTLKYQLKAHIKKKHTVIGSAKDYKCLECSYQTDYKNNFQRHLNKHRNIKQFTCDICLVKYTDKSNLARHIKNKHTDNVSVKDYNCLECSYHTNYKSSLQRHLNKHRGIKAFTCDICMTKFTLKDSLKKHIRNKHTDDGRAKDHKCAECFYQTNHKRNFQLHVNEHRSIKPFTCDICMLKFTQKSNLNRHIKKKH